jgi:hypothetical protein
MSFGGGGSGSGKIATATDVALSGVADGQVLTYDGTLAKWKNAAAAGGAVSSVAGRTGAVVLAASDVGLGNVDNTSDAAKPVSTAQQAALDAKVPIDVSPAGDPGAPVWTRRLTTALVAVLAALLAFGAYLPYHKRKGMKETALCHSAAVAAAVK